MNKRRVLHETKVVLESFLDRRGSRFELIGMKGRRRVEGREKRWIVEMGNEKRRFGVCSLLVVVVSFVSRLVLV